MQIKNKFSMIFLFIIPIFSLISSQKKERNNHLIEVSPGMKVDPLIFNLFQTAGILARQDQSQPINSIDRVFLNACKNNRSIEFAIAKGANIQVVDPLNGCTALHYTCMNNNEERVKFLLEKNLNIEIKDYYGRTALHYAAEQGYLSIVEQLLKKGAQEFCDIRGKRPFDLSTDLTIKSCLLRARTSKIGEKSKDPEKIDTNEIKSVSFQAMANELSKSVEKLKVAINEVKQDKEKSALTEKKTNKKTKKTIGKKPVKSAKKSKKKVREIKSSDQLEETTLPKEKDFGDEKKSSEEPSIALEKSKPSLLERAQKTIVHCITGKTTETISKQTYAAALNLNSQHIQSNREAQEEKSIVVVDDHLKITVPIAGSQQLMLTDSQKSNNPLINIDHYSEHVLEKMAKESDLFHNFSPQVEQTLGHLAVSENIGDHKLQYTIKAQIELPWGKAVNGAFNYIVKNLPDGSSEMRHRFFNPEKKKKQKNSRLLLPSSSDTHNK